MKPELFCSRRIGYGGGPHRPSTDRASKALTRSSLIYAQLM
jgi:hypothetical protein